ncbi:hypothetical protein DI09_9p230 [Mitosporidium daphniae]|uniref:Uncharacterized protein n=1 Tax=Mitosporidium daphniae TaxID=1485682 RepID=A0A098VLZ0_9MICR|nr:uncharacterized protein DI09_9p230 [Mitosporidium daphniae]KGG49940.1 hypothetical protein DI09_9p230 [Mitosporidium daphniae]|eukprot:XP_013236367.1 uncharacterized protein DI09_9p230 [Mitosporidium daphniae]
MATYANLFYALRHNSPFYGVCVWQSENCVRFGGRLHWRQINVLLQVGLISVLHQYEPPSHSIATGDKPIQRYFIAVLYGGFFGHKACGQAHAHVQRVLPVGPCISNIWHADQ